MVPGHEIVGTVAALGPEVRHLEAGARVGVGWQRGACLACDSCAPGTRTCARGTWPPAWATTAASPTASGSTAASRSRSPRRLASENAAPLLCGGVTVYSPLRRWVKPSMRVGVVGIGGLGHLGLQFARAMGCEVTAISSTPDKEAEARAFGAHRFLATREPKALALGGVEPRLRPLHRLRAPDWDGLLGALRPNGVLCFVGAHERAPVGPGVHPPRGAEDRHRLAIGGRPAIREMLAFAARHGVAAKTQVRPLAEADAALGDVGRAARATGSSSRREARPARSAGRSEPRPVWPAKALVCRRSAVVPGPLARRRTRVGSEGSQGDHDHGGEPDSLPHHEARVSSAARSPPGWPSPRGPEPRPRFPRLEVPR